MNKLSDERRIMMLRLLVEGNGVMAISRIVGCSKNTVAKFIRDLGKGALAFHRFHVEDVQCVDVQCDELTSFIRGRNQNLTAKQRRDGNGNRYTWVAIEPISKLILCWHVGGRTRQDAKEFLQELAAVVRGAPRIATDAYAAYLPEIVDAFNWHAPHFIMKKNKTECDGKVHTSFIERMNLTLRTCNKRFARRTNGFSKCPKFHQWALAITMCWYNFGRHHKSVKTTPAVKAGICDAPLSHADFLLMADGLLPHDSIHFRPGI